MLERWQHGREDLESKVLLVAEAVRASLEDSDLVVQALHEAERDLVLGLTIRRDPIPVAFDHRGELLERCESFPLEGVAPILEEPARPSLPAVAPQLPEGFLEQVGGVEPLVGREQQVEALPARERQMLAVGKERVLLPLDEAAILAREPRVLALAYLVERIAQV